MKIMKQLIKLHRLLFITAILATFLSIIFQLCWNQFLAVTLDSLGDAAFFDFENSLSILFAFFISGISIILLHTVSEYLSSYLASYTCEIFSHEMRMGYVRYYLQGDFQQLSKLNAGEEQSAMQNELKEVSDYLNGNLFSLMKQFGTFAATVIFLFCQNRKLAVISIVPVIPLIIYCSFSSKIIKNAAQQCLNSKKKINGSADMILELFPMIQVYASYGLIQNTIRENLMEWENANVRKERMRARLMSLSGVLSFVPLLLLLGFGGAMVINGEISTGVFYIFINLSGNVSGFLQNMPGIYANFRQFGAAVDKLEEKLVLRKV